MSELVFWVSGLVFWMSGLVFWMSALDFGSASGTEFWITTEEDSEMLSARVQEISSKIQDYQAGCQKIH